MLGSRLLATQMAAFIQMALKTTVLTHINSVFGRLMGVRTFGMGSVKLLFTSHASQNTI
jgi:hypothetical protein